MKFLAFIVGMAGGYTLAHAAGLGAGGAAAIGWAFAIAAVLLAAGMRGGYGEAWEIEKYRPRAQHLGKSDPDLYDKIVATNTKRDDVEPDVYVAAWLAAAEERSEPQLMPPRRAIPGESPTGMRGSPTRSAGTSASTR